MNITAVIPTLNEEKDLRKALRSLKGLVAEVLVVDSGSTDKTLEIAQEYHARVIHHPFKNFADTRNFADRHASFDWIISLDADMEVPPALAGEIMELPDSPAAYRIGRVNIIFGKPILHADWGPADDCHIRLYHRSLGRWRGKVHELYTTSVKPRKLKHHFLHHNYQTINEYLEKLNRYSDISASMSPPPSYFRFFIDPLYDFLKRYFYKLGFLDGWHGLFLSYLQAIYFLTVGIKQKTK